MKNVINRDENRVVVLWQLIAIAQVDGEYPRKIPRLVSIWWF